MTDMDTFRVQLDRIEGKVDELRALEVRVAKLEVHQLQQAETSKEVVGLRAAAGLQEEVAKLRSKVEVLERTSERRQGVTEGMKLIWLALAGTPGMLAIAGLIYWITHSKP